MAASTRLAMAERVGPAGEHGSAGLAVIPGGAGPETSGSVRDAAVIDLGSNSFRLVTYEYVSGSWWRRSGQLQEPVRVAAGLAASGRLSRAATKRGLQTLDMFARYCRARGIQPGDVEAVATSAVREASNGRELVASARAATGFAVRVLSADEEANYGYLAAVNSTTLTDGAVLDLGGGSMQLVAVRDRSACERGSWPLGAVRVTERLLPGRGPVSRKELKRARASVRRELAGADWLAESGPRLVAVGGAVRNLAAAAQRASALDAAGLQGYVLRAGELRGLVATLAGLPARARALPGIKPARADIVLGAALALEAALDIGGFDGIEVTHAGLREGLFFESRLFAGRSPLVPDVREAAVRDFAIQHGADLGHAEHVAGLALQLHDSLVEGGVVVAADDERELLRAAATLHDVGTTIGYDGHQGHARYLILKAGLAGFGPRETALIAQIVRYHRKGSPDLDDLKPLAHAGDRDLVRRCALILRLAAVLETGQARSIREARLVAEGNELRLRLSGDPRLARWCVERQMDRETFRRILGRRLVAG